MNMHGIQEKLEVILDEGLRQEKVGQVARNQLVLHKNKAVSKLKSLGTSEIEDKRDNFRVKTKFFVDSGKEREDVKRILRIRQEFMSTITVEYSRKHLQ